MIAALGGWLKEVILIVLLAAFVDLLLPNQAMQRYVRAVLGLIVLLALIAPLFRLLSTEWDLRHLSRSVEELAAMPATAVGGSAPGDAIPPLETIMKEAERLRNVQDRRMRRWVEDRVAALVKEEVAAWYPQVSVRSVRVSTGTGRDGGNRLTGIEVEVAEAAAGDEGAAGRIGDAESGGGADGEDEGKDRAADSGTADIRVEIDPIKPVASIKPIEPIRIGSGSRARPAAGPAPTELPDGDRLAGDIRRTLAERWQLSVRQVEVRYVRESSRF